MADNNTAGANGQGDTPVSAVQRVQNYSPVVQASEKAQQYYSMAKEMNPHVKSGLDFAESKLASLSAVIWPYVEPALEKIDPVANKQLDYLEEKYTESAPVVEQKYAELHDKALKTVESVDKKVDEVLPAAENDENKGDDEAEVAQAHEKSIRGEIYQVSQKLSSRLYARAAENVTRAHNYTRSFAPKENINGYIEYIDQQKTYLATSLASTQAYVLSAVQDAPQAAQGKIDELRKTAAVQTAMDMAHSLTATVSNLGAKANVMLPESLAETVKTMVERLRGYYTGLRAGDDQVAVSNTLKALTDDTLRVWEQIKGNLAARIAQTPGPVVAPTQN